jgi:hypothetical protein
VAPAQLAVELAKSYDETSLGISTFIRDGDSFSGIIKSRFSDFLVHEIDLSGQVVRLTSTQLPQEEQKTDKVEVDESAQKQQGLSHFTHSLYPLLNNIYALVGCDWIDLIQASKPSNLWLAMKLPRLSRPGSCQRTTKPTKSASSFL